MTKLFALCTVLLFSHCAITTGTYDPNNKKDTPLMFKYAGTKNDLRILLKRHLVENGFSILNDDVEAGIIVTNPKILQDDEKYNTSGMILLGVSNSVDQGIISIIYSETDSINTTFKVICKLTYSATYSQNAYKNSNMSGEVQVLPQGHPFPMKIRNALSKIEKVNYVE